MHLYLVVRTDEIDYDEYRGAVVRAANAADAKQIMFDQAGHGFWSARKIASTGPAEVILSDFKAG